MHYNDFRSFVSGRREVHSPMGQFIGRALLTLTRHGLEAPLHWEIITAASIIKCREDQLDHNKQQSFMEEIMHIQTNKSASSLTLTGKPVTC
jgi:hypothetical protein